MARLGNIRLDIETENDSASIDTTNYPAERSPSFIDHIITKPDEFSLSGFILGDNYVKDKKYLKDEMKKGTVFTYVGRNIAKDVIITGISGSMDNTVMNGSSIDISLQQVRFAKTAWQAVNNTGQKKPVDKSSGNGRPMPAKATYHTAKKGDTYSELSKKYGTKISQLRTWNKYKDREIPVGAKLRVK